MGSPPQPTPCVLSIATNVVMRHALLTNPQSETNGQCPASCRDTGSFFRTYLKKPARFILEFTFNATGLCHRATTVRGIVVVFLRLIATEPVSRFTHLRTPNFEFTRHHY